MDVPRRIFVLLLIAIVFLPLHAIPQEAPKQAAPKQDAVKQDAPKETAKPLKPEELDQLVAPIALHPDALLAQVLMASTYPLEVVQAARFIKANANLKGDQLNESLKQQTWDDSVKSLVTFPQVLTMMNEKLDWLQKLGDAFLGQQQELMAAIQRLRARAQETGQLKSTAEQKVIVEPAAAAPAPAASASPVTQAPPSASAQTTVQVVQQPAPPPTVIKIEPTNPQVVYVPSYDPTVVYGAFPPAYPPYYPYPFGYFAAGAFAFTAGVAVGAALWGGCSWHGGGGEVNINNNVANNFSSNVNNRNEAKARVEQRNSSRQSGSGGQNRSSFQHNPEHRKGVQYRDNATQQRFNKTGPGNAQSREGFRGRSGQGSDVGRAAQQGGQGTRDRQGGAGQGGSLGDRGGQGGQGGSFGDRGGQGGSRGEGGGGGDRGGQGGGFGQGGAGQGRQGGGAFEGVGSGRDTQSFSDRGNASRESFNRSSGGGGARAGGGGGGGGGGRGGGGGGRGGRR
jgi:Protein of unknown function (DUF3300)